jgi:multicomponent Na+:H+ antiporter subunit A
MGAQVTLVLFVAHAAYKATLFMVAGIFEKVTGQKDIQNISGLGQFIPMTFLGSGTAALSMIGFPPTLGFLSKELLLEIGLSETWSMPLWIIGFALMGSVAWLVGIKPFLGRARSSSSQLYQPGVLIAIGPLILGLASIIFSFDPFDVVSSQLHDSLMMNQQIASLHLWAGLSLPLFFSIIIVMLAGLGVYLHPQVLSWVKNHHKPSKPLSDMIFDSVFETVLKLAKFLTELFQNGNLTRYLLLVFWGLIFLAISLLFKTDVLSYLNTPSASPVTLVAIALAVIMIICISFIVTTERRLSAIASMGGIGYSTAAFYVLLGAPDLALTQVIVETLSVILFVFLLHQVPLLKSERKIWPNQGWAAITSLLVGIIVSVFTWHSLSSEVAPSISDYFGQNSYLRANGKNIVNVILVDFRGFDTMGEITVLSIAAVTLTALLIDQIFVKESK